MTRIAARTPVWLLDVDGVINAYRAGWYSSPRVVQIFSTIDVYDYRIRFEPRLITAIRDLHESGLVEVTWCSTWCAEAAALEEGFGLPSLPRAFSTPVPASAPSATGCELKWAAAQRVIASGRRLIWTDDVEVDHHRTELPAGQALLISPNASRGLRPAHLRLIRRFL